MFEYRQQSQDWDNREEDVVQFEKIARREHVALPVSSRRGGARAAKETDGSRRVRREISQRLGGIHRRRNRKID